MATVLSVVRGPERRPPADGGPARRGANGARTHRRPRSGASAAASVAAGVAVLVCVTARLPDRLLRTTGVHGWAPALVGVMALVIGARAIAQAPFTFAHRESSARRWLAEQGKGLAATIVVGAAVTVPLYGLMRATPYWWVWAWILFAVVTVAAQIAMPCLLRIQTGPLSPAPPWLAGRVGAVASMAGVDMGRGVLTAGAVTGRGRRCNAYVVGWGTTRRVVLESAITTWPPDLIDQVVAHEIGHWRMRHTANRLPAALLAQLATFALAGTVLSLPAVLGVAGVTRLGDPRSYPWLLALTTVLVMPARLALAGVDRAQERQADKFAVTLLGQPTTFAAMLDRAAGEGDVPVRLSWWRRSTASHPPIGERILACQRLASPGRGDAQDLSP